MSMSLGLKVGFRKTLYFNAGVLTGFCIITLLCAFFCAKLNDTHVGAGNALSHLACPVPPCDYPTDNAAKEIGGNQTYYEPKNAEQGEH